MLKKIDNEMMIEEKLMMVVDKMVKKMMEQM
jgi:hypothetical protein